MRRSIWCGGVVLIGAASWVYLAATYVCNHPDSYVSRCAEIAFGMDGEFNPVSRISHACVKRVHVGVDQMLESYGYVHSSPKECCVCEPCVPSLAAIAASAPPLEGLHIELTSGKVDEIKCGVSEECTSGVITVGAFAPPADDDADPAPKVMPALPPDGQADEAPATMPYEEDENDAEGTALFDFWKEYESKKAAPKKAEATKEGDTAPKTMKPEEESEAPPEGAAGEMPQSGMYQMPASHYSSHPSCSSCPGTVTCPYTGRTYPADPKDDPKEEVVPTPTLKKKKKKKDDAGNTPGKVSKLIQLEKGTEEVPVHPEVDTMEFRRADGKKGEFAAQPE